MAIWMAVMLAAAGFPPEDDGLPRSLQADEPRRSVEGIVSVRAGAWTGRGFDFQAIRLDSTQATSDQQVLFSAGILAGVQLFEHVVVLGTYEASAASKITAHVGGAYVGWRERPKERYGKGVPDEVLIYGGVLSGRIHVHTTAFGNFKPDVGFGVGIALGWSISPRFTFQLYGEYRYLRFEYDQEVLFGDKHMGGNAAWVGVGMDLRF